MPITLDGTNGITTPTYGGADTSEYLVPVTQFKNRIINGAMVIDQRNAGASVTPTNGSFTLDRYSSFVSQASKITIQQNAGSVTPPVGFTNYLGITSTSAYSVNSTDYFWISQAIEGFNISDFGWGTANAQTVTLSFWVRSSLTGTFSGSFRNGSGTTRSYVFSYTINSANTWEYKTITIAGDTTGTWLTNNGMGTRLTFCIGSGSTRLGSAGSWQSADLDGVTGTTSVVGTNGATFYITGVQLEVGSTATSFDYRPYGTELALCQRYYEKWLQTDQNTVGFCYATNNLNTYNQFLVEKRATPTLTRNGTFTAYVNGGGNTMTYSAYYGSTKAININWTGGGVSAGQAFAWSSQTNPQLEFSAEL